MPVVDDSARLVTRDTSSTKDATGKRVCVFMRYYFATTFCVRVCMLIASRYNLLKCSHSDRTSARGLSVYCKVARIRGKFETSVSTSLLVRVLRVTQNKRQNEYKYMYMYVHTCVSPRQDTRHDKTTANQPSGAVSPGSRESIL